MSTLNENVLGPIRRRSSRAGSRASSRAGSEEIDEDRGTTPRRSGRLAAHGTKVGNKESAAYGAKAKPLSNPELSADAQHNAAASIAAAVAGAKATLPPTGGEAGQLPVISEESESSSAAANRARERGVQDENSGGQNSESQDLEDQNLEDQNLGGQNLGNQGAPAANEGQLRFQTICTKLRALIGWAPGLERNSSNTTTHHDELPMGGTGVVTTSVSKALAWLLAIAMLLLISMAVLQIDLYTGPRLKLNVNLLDRHFANVPSGTTIVHDPRLSAMEKVLYRLASKSKTVEVVHPRHQIDWFAQGNRAAIDPYLTSPTFDPEYCYPTLRNWSYYVKSFFVNTPKYCNHIAPASALLPWSEPDDRWCAPPSYGQLQLAIITSRMVSPTELVIEHLPEGAAVDSGTAPKNIELFMEVKDDVSYETLKNVIEQFQPDLLKPPSPQDPGRDLDDAQALPEAYLRVGRWTYNIHNPEHKQIFLIPLALTELGVKTDHFALRVLSNWDDRGETCIYRTRLHGHHMQQHA